MTRVLHILPRVPPSTCGVGDYAWLLARAMRDQHGIASSFLSAGTTWIEPIGTEFPVERLPFLTTSSLTGWMGDFAGRFDAAVLHVSPYGYQKRATPFWLASAWRQISRSENRPVMMAMFHELYASGPITTSTFWLQPFQKVILRSLARASDVVRTNRQPYAEWLKKIPNLARPEVTVMPVFSNFGEPQNLPPLRQRPEAMILFSSGIHGGGTPSEAVSRATRLCVRFGLKTLHIIGGPKPELAEVDGICLRHQAFVPTEEASDLFLQCRMAYTGYHPLYFGKSTILAAFAAHGLAVITRGQQALLPDDLMEGREVLHEDGLDSHALPDFAELEAMANRLYQWYGAHDLAHNAASYAKELAQSLAARRKKLSSLVG